MDQTGKAILRHTDTIYSALLAEGVDQAEIDAIMGRLAQPAAERDVPGWESKPPLRSEMDFTLGAGTQIVNGKVPILGGDHYWSILLPAVEEWSAGLYRGQALLRLQQAAADPLAYVMELFEVLVRRSGADALKRSFYETASFLLSSPGAEVDPDFFSICPPNQQMAVIRQVVEINRANFIEWWEGMPIPLKRLIFSFRLASIENINALSESVILYSRQMTMALQAQLHTSGGADDTGTEDSGASPVERLPILPQSEI